MPEENDYDSVLENRRATISNLDSSIREKELSLRELELNISTIDSKYETAVRENDAMYSKFNMDNERQQSIRRNIETMVTVVQKCLGDKSMMPHSDEMLKTIQTKMQIHIENLDPNI